MVIQAAAIASIVEANQTTVEHDDTECDCSTVAANDETTAQYYLSACLYSHSCRTCRNGGVQNMHRPIQGTFDSNTRQRRRALGELQSDPKHAFMSRFGGPGSWRFVPYIFSPLHVKKPMLLTLESREIHLYLKHLNKEKRFRRKRVKTGTAAKSRHAAIGLATCPQRTGDTEEVLQ